MQGRTEKFGGPWQIFNSGNLFFPPIFFLGGGEVKNFSQTYPKKNPPQTPVKLTFKKFSGQILVKSRLKHIFLDQ